MVSAIVSGVAACTGRGREGSLAVSCCKRRRLGALVGGDIDRDSPTERATVRPSMEPRRYQTIS